MFELFALIVLFLVGILVLKLVFGVLGLVFHLALLPLKLLVGLVVMVLFLPLLALLLPVAVVAVIGFGLFVVGAVVAGFFGLLSGI